MIGNYPSKRIKLSGQCTLQPLLEAGDMVAGGLVEGG